MSIFLTADSHFSHPFMAKSRGLDIPYMDKLILDTWNSQIKRGDEVYILGDFAFGKNDEVRRLRSKIKGKLHLILGNHDYKNNIQRLTDCFTSMRDLMTLNYKKQKIILCHYCMDTFEASHYDSYHCFGHSHCHYSPSGKRMDVGVDGNNYRLWPLDDILDIMGSKPHNFNYIPPEERHHNI